MHIISVMTILLITILTMYLSKSFKPFKPSIISQEVSVALNRGEELKKLKERLSAAKLIMEKDPSAKPWMLSRFWCRFFLDSSFLLPEFYNVRIGRKGKLNSIDSMQSNQSNSTLGHKGRVPKKDVKSIAFVMKDGEGTFFKYTNTDKSKRPVHPKCVRHYMFVKLIYFCYQVDL